MTNLPGQYCSIVQKVFRVAMCLLSYPAYGYSKLDAAAQTDIKVQKLIAISGAYCKIGAEMLRAFLTATIINLPPFPIARYTMGRTEQFSYCIYINRDYC